MAVDQVPLRIFYFLLLFPKFKILNDQNITVKLQNIKVQAVFVCKIRLVTERRDPTIENVSYEANIVAE